jgi:chromosome partitioning protein
VPWQAIATGNFAGAAGNHNIQEYMAFTICFINQKGGCGKSSTCFHLSGQLVRAGFRTLLVDADPQGSLGQGFFGSSSIENLDARATLAAIFEDEEFVPSDSLIVATSIAGISIIRANQTLAAHNVPCPERTGMKQFALRSFLDAIVGFDFVFIDCPPNLYQCSWNAMLAADFVVIPVPPEDFATQGLRVIHQAIDHAQAVNHRLHLLGQLVTRVDRRLLVHRTYEHKLRHVYGDTVFATTIPEASAFKVSLSCRQPACFFCPASKATKAMAALANEILERIAQAEPRRMAAGHG